MEAQSQIRIYQWIAILACIIILGCVWFAAHWLYDSKTDDVVGEVNAVVQNGLPFSASAALDDYPDYSFMADKKWSSRKTELLKVSGVRAIDSQGSIDGYPLILDCVLTPEGAVAGRYYNKYNGIHLNVNGYIESETAQLKIRLGHDSEISYLTLSPSGIESSDNDKIYKYDGAWGKKQLPAEMSFTLAE